MRHHGTYYATCMKRQGGGAADEGVGIGCVFAAAFWLLVVALIVWWAA